VCSADPSKSFLNSIDPEADKWRERCPGWYNSISITDPLICIIALSDLGKSDHHAARRSAIGGDTSAVANR
jgi:hypothetical protein